MFLCYMCNKNCDSANMVCENCITSQKNKIKEAYNKGLADGITKFAWWKDGTQYVGTTGKTLKKALEEL